jgi:hypothetical protein
MEERQDQMIARAYDLVEQRLIDGTATSQETTYFLKLASDKERLELEKQRQEIKLAEAKIKALEAEQSHTELFEKVVAALRSYQGADYEEEQDLY